jgi:hypothetical protein
LALGVASAMACAALLDRKFAMVLVAAAASTAAAARQSKLIATISPTLQPISLVFSDFAKPSRRVLMTDFEHRAEVEAVR